MAALIAQDAEFPQSHRKIKTQQRSGEY